MSYCVQVFAHRDDPTHPCERGDPDGRWIRAEQLIALLLELETFDPVNHESSAKAFDFLNRWPDREGWRARIVEACPSSS